MIEIFERLKPADDGKIRTVLSPGATNTGRFGSGTSFLEASTNLQNIPKKAAKRNPLYDVRGVMTPSPGKVLVEGDLSSAERRLLAYLAGESTAIKQIVAGVNAYKWFAGRLFNISDWENIAKSSAMYHIGKTSVLSLDRGVSWKTLKDSINGDADLTGASITAKQSKEAVALFHNVYPGYQKYFTRVGDAIRKHGFLVNIHGRKRHFFNRVRSESEWSATVREGVSFQAQAIGDVLNARLAEIYEKFDPHLLQLLLQIHDAILWETDPSDSRSGI